MRRLTAALLAPLAVTAALAGCSSSGPSHPAGDSVRVTGPEGKAPAIKIPARPPPLCWWARSLTRSAINYQAGGVTRLSGVFAAAAVAGLLSATGAADAKTLGIVALLANDALNIDVIGGATEGAKAAGWDVKVIDTQASADKANAAMNTFAVEKVDAMFVLAFAATSVGSGLEAARQAHIPVAMWGGERVPGVVLAVDPKLEHPTPDRWFNTSAFAQPTAFTFGNAPRTMPYLRAHGTNNFDFSAQKYWGLWSEQSRLQFRTEFFNFFNRTTFYNPWSFFGDPNFGRVLQAYPARSIQLGLKLYW